MAKNIATANFSFLLPFRDLPLINKFSVEKFFKDKIFKKLKKPIIIL